MVQCDFAECVYALFEEVAQHVLNPDRLQRRQDARYLLLVCDVGAEADVALYDVVHVVALQVCDDEGDDLVGKQVQRQLVLLPLRISLESAPSRLWSGSGSGSGSAHRDRLSLLLPDSIPLKKLLLVADMSTDEQGKLDLVRFAATMRSVGM